MADTTDKLPGSGLDDTRRERALPGDAPESVYIAARYGNTNALTLEHPLFRITNRERELAEAAQRSVGMSVPEARSVIAVVAENEGCATVLAADGRLAYDRVCPFEINLSPPLLAALASREITHAALSGKLRMLLPSRWSKELDDERPLLTCLALPQIAPNAVIAVFHSTESGHLVDSVLGTLAEMLSDPALVAASDPGLNAIVRRAKHEWEHTVDALDELVLLVDHNGAILRANRAVERWHLGNVADVRGITAHTLLHRNCEGASCRLDRLLGCRWKTMITVSDATSFNLFDRHLARDLQITLQKIAHCDDPPNPDASFGVIVINDITELSNAQRALRRMNEELENRVEKRTEELRLSNEDLHREIERRELAERELHKSRDELSRLSKRLIDSQEVERRNIALELHDSIGQSLGALKYSLERFVAVNNNPALGNPDKILNSTVELLQRAITDTRSIAMSLRPSLLDDLGAASAISWLCRWFSETYVDICMTTTFLATNAEIPDELSAAVFRITQEALNNVAKHSDARNVSVLVQSSHCTLTLKVVDDGIGFSANSNKQPIGQGFGILGMRERAEMTDGSFSVVSHPGSGTSVTAEWDTAARTRPGNPPDMQAASRRTLLLDCPVT